MAKYRNAHAIFMLLLDKDMFLTWPDLKTKSLLVKITITNHFYKVYNDYAAACSVNDVYKFLKFPFPFGIKRFQINTYHVLINSVTEICKAVLISCIMLKISLLFL